MKFHQSFILSRVTYFNINWFVFHKLLKFRKCLDSKNGINNNSTLSAENTRREILYVIFFYCAIASIYVIWYTFPVFLIPLSVSFIMILVNKRQFPPLNVVIVSAHDCLSSFHLHLLLAPSWYILPRRQSADHRKRGHREKTEGKGIGWSVAHTAAPFAVVDSALKRKCCRW